MVLKDRGEQPETSVHNDTLVAVTHDHELLKRFEMNTLYFDDEVPELITMEAANRVMDSELDLPIPLYVRFQARGNPIVGTSLDYFDFRGLRIAEGRQLALLGDCVLGASVAKSSLSGGYTNNGFPMQRAATAAVITRTSAG